MSLFWVWFMAVLTILAFFANILDLWIDWKDFKDDNQLKKLFGRNNTKGDKNG